MRWIENIRERGRKVRKKKLESLLNDIIKLAEETGHPLSEKTIKECEEIINRK